MKKIQVIIEIEVPDELADQKNFVDDTTFDIEWRITKYSGSMGNNGYLEQKKYPIGNKGTIRGYPYRIIAAIV